MTPPPVPLKTLAAAAVLFALTGCQPSQARAVPSVAQIGSDLKCPNGDHGFEDPQVGWGFCYPNGWKYTERAQASQSPLPSGLDLTFDITFAPTTPVPCPTSSTTGASPSRSSAPCSGQFAFMIISTYQRGGATDLASWEHAFLATEPVPDPISWGNAVEAARFADGRRIALTPHYVVIMELHSGEGLLDLEAAMSTRLDTWKFSY